MTDLLKSRKASAGSRAAALIYKEGPMSRTDLFAKVDFGSKPSARLDSLARSIDAGWLQITTAGMVGLTETARLHLEAEDEEAAQPVGQIATPRTCNVYLRKPYSPPKRVIRQDVPEWSVRPAGFQFHTIAG